MDAFAEILDVPTQHNLAAVKPAEKREATPPMRARELAAMIQQTQQNLGLVLERLTEATERGLRDSLGVSGGGGERVGGTQDHTQAMLNRLGGGGDRRDKESGKMIAIPIEIHDDARKHLATLAASVEAARDWSKRAFVETARLAPLSQEKAKLLLGDGPSKCGNVNCGRDVWNTAQDHLRAGRCHTCYVYWDRHDRNQERPKALCDGKAVTGNTISGTTED